MIKKITLKKWGGGICGQKGGASTFFSNIRWDGKKKSRITRDPQIGKTG